jgi:hypothetical protein
MINNSHCSLRLHLLLVHEGFQVAPKECICSDEATAGRSTYHVMMFRRQSRHSEAFEYQKEYWGRHQLQERKALQMPFFVGCILKDSNAGDSRLE